MVQQQEDIKRTAHPESGESEGAKVKSPGADQRRAAWEKTLESFVERFDFTPVDLKPDEYPGVERKQLLNALAFAAELLEE
jgi:hypothetical protein